MEEKNEILTDALFFIILVIPSILLSAYTGMNLWNWFISTTFNVVALSLAQAMGVDVVISYFTYKKTESKLEDKKFKHTLGLVSSMSITATFLLMGFIIKQFM